jgi:Clp amino terminal domain, pathogenicity island component
VFERLTERACRVVVLAQDEALALGHRYIGTEHGGRRYERAAKEPDETRPMTRGSYMVSE